MKKFIPLFLLFCCVQPVLSMEETDSTEPLTVTTKELGLFILGHTPTTPLPDPETEPLTRKGEEKHIIIEDLERPGIPPLHLYEWNKAQPGKDLDPPTPMHHNDEDAQKTPLPYDAKKGMYSVPMNNHEHS